MCDPAERYCSPDDPNLYEPGIFPQVQVFFIATLNTILIFVLTWVQTLFNVTDAVNDAINGQSNATDQAVDAVGFTLYMLYFSYIYAVYYGIQTSLLFLNLITFGAIDFIGTINSYSVRFLGVEGSFLIKLATLIFLLIMGITSDEDGYFNFMLLWGIPAFTVEWWMYGIGPSAARSLDPSYMGRGMMWPFLFRLIGFGDEPFPDPNAAQ